MSTKRREKRRLQSSERRGVSALWRAALTCCLAAAALLLGTPAAAQAQTGAIAGRVTSADSGEPLPGVNVLVADLTVEGTRLGTATSASGEYTIEGVPAGDHTVEVRFVGYQTERNEVTVEAGQTATLDFSMGSAAVEMNEVVVSVAAGDLTRKETGVDLESVDPQEIENAVASNVSELISGRAEGVTIQQGSGNVGAGSKIRIRGISSLTQDNNPLLIVDGVRVSNDTGVGITRGQTFSRFNDLDPQSIKSVQIVKGPAATALYGSEAAPGVIVIETKTGTGATENTQVSFRTEATALQDVTDYPDNYASVSEFGITDPGDPRLEGVPAEQNPLTGEVYVTDNPFEDADTTPFRTGYSVNSNLSLQGAVEGFSYYTSLGYEDQRGVLISNDADDLSFRLNVEGSPSDYLSVRANTGYVSSTTNLPKSGNNTSGFFLNALGGQPLASRNARGECLGTVVAGADPSLCDKEGNIRASFDKIAPITSREDLERFNASLRMSLFPFSGATVTAKLGADVINQTFQDAIPFDPDVPFGFAAGGENFETRNQTRNYTADFSARYNYQVLEELSANTAVGAQYFQDLVETVSCEGRVFPNDQATACDAAVSIRGFSDYFEKREAGAYLQQGISYNDYFFATGALRVDDNSALGEEEPAIVSPSFNASLVASDLPFWSAGPVSRLRLRGAWGRASQSPEQYAANRTYVITRLGSEGGVVPGLTPSAPGNPNLGPERSEEFEAGFDAGLWDERLSLSFTYYRQSITDAIVSRPVAPSTGFAQNQFVNIGALENQGVEASLEANILTSDRFTWDARLGFSTTYSEVTELGFDEPIFTGVSQVLQEGFSPGAYISRVITDAERDAEGNIVPESVEYAEGNIGDGSGRRVVGQPFPTNTQSLSTTATLFENFRLYALLERKGGHEIFSGTLAQRSPGDIGGLQSSFGADYAYRQTRMTPVEQAMVERDERLGNHDAVFVHDADFIKWRELRLTYQLHESLLPQLAGGMRVFVGGRNLLTITDYPGLDPEVNVSGARDNLTIYEANALPPARSIFAGFALTF